MGVPPGLLIPLVVLPLLKLSEKNVVCDHPMAVVRNRAIEIGMMIFGFMVVVSVDVWIGGGGSVLKIKNRYLSFSGRY